jgi:hypothetical protein
VPQHPLLLEAAMEFPLPIAVAEATSPEKGAMARRYRLTAALTCCISSLTSRPEASA